MDANVAAIPVDSFDWIISLDTCSLMHSSEIPPVLGLHVCPSYVTATIKWLRSMAPMTSDLSGFITTLTFFPQGIHLHTHTHACAHAPTHTRMPLHLDGFSNAIDLIDSKGLLFHDQRFPLMCVWYILHTVLRRRENHKTFILTMAL